MEPGQLPNNEANANVRLFPSIFKLPGAITSPAIMVTSLSVNTLGSKSTVKPTPVVVESSER